jgi:hypothetical protein
MPGYDFREGQAFPRFKMSRFVTIPAYYAFQGEVWDKAVSYFRQRQGHIALPGNTTWYRIVSVPCANALGWIAAVIAGYGVPGALGDLQVSD